jgi:hypothetical protein
MCQRVRLSIAAVLVLATTATATLAQQPVRIRGTIRSLEGNVLEVKARDEKGFRIALPENLVVVAAKKLGFDDIKPGDLVGPASRVKPDGSLEAISLQVFPASLRGVVPEGHMPWDLEPGSMMTNGSVTASVKAAGARDLTIEYKGGSQTVRVPDDIPIFTTVPADRSLLVPGAYIVTTARIGRDGVLFTQRLAVSKDGIRPAN